MRHTLFAGTGAVLLSLSAAAAAHEDKGHDTAYPSGGPAKASQAERTVTIETKGMRFHPGTIDVEPGEAVTFVVKNTAQLPHSFMIGTPQAQRRHGKKVAQMSREERMHHDDPNMVMLKPGQTKRLTWRFPKDPPAVVKYGCHVPGHFDAGMVGRFRF